MIVKDDRTPEQVKTHPMIVVGSDPFMSGWGKASGGESYAGWACREGYVNACESWVRNRGDMKRVRIVGPGYHPGRGCAHFHIYVWEDSREALQ